LCIVTEGPLERNSKGVTLPEFAQLAASFNVKNAYNLDGGYSSALIFRNQKINAPGNTNHRDINDIIYFASAYIPPEESKK
jgi:exopolysaccharide biosynthesis protein